MTYEERMNTVRTQLLTFVGECITEHHNHYFDMWFYSGDAAAAFGDTYVLTFKTQFEPYITPEIESKLWFAGQNITFAIQAFVKSNPRHTLNTLLKFAENVVKVQLHDVDNWCNDLYMAYPDDETTDDVQIEDNPA
jgi:hypothetical protein